MSFATPHPESCLEPEELEEEERHFRSILAAFASYQQDVERILRKYRLDWAKLPFHQQKLVPSYPSKIKRAAECVEANQEFFDLVVASVTDHSQDKLSTSKRPLNATESENLRSLLRQLAREWSAEGAVEREASYAGILTKLGELFPLPSARCNTRIFVPGAGLGRLAAEIAQLGFTTEGNEFSHFMLLPSQFILNSSGAHTNHHTIYPWALPFSNIWSWEQDQMRPVTIPDWTPSHPLGEFSMIAGDFLQIYHHPSPHGGDSQRYFDVIVSSFFLDTAPNVLEYLECFYRILQPGGYWINNGPLLYHFEGSAGEMSIELSSEEIKSAAENIGFEFLVINLPYVEAVLSDTLQF